MNFENAPLPWRADPYGYNSVIDAEGVHVCECVCEEDAVMIARIGNSHDALVKALSTLMFEIDPPMTGKPSFETLIEFWEYEKTQGRGEADAKLFALRTLAAAGVQHGA